MGEWFSDVQGVLLWDGLIVMLSFGWDNNPMLRLLVRSWNTCPVSWLPQTFLLTSCWGKGSTWGAGVDQERGKAGAVAPQTFGFGWGLAQAQQASRTRDMLGRSHHGYRPVACHNPRFHLDQRLNCRLRAWVSNQEGCSSLPNLWKSLRWRSPPRCWWGTHLRPLLWEESWGNRPVDGLLPCGRSQTADP